MARAAKLGPRNAETNSLAGIQLRTYQIFEQHGTNRRAGPGGSAESEFTHLLSRGLIGNPVAVLL